MLKVGITGNIASGKSEFQRLLTKKGYMVVDTDKICHEILLKNTEVIEHLKEYFANQDILDEDGNISRSKLAKLAFANDAYRYKLDTIMHPLVRKRLATIFKKYEKMPQMFVAVPLLFEAKMEDLFDVIILVAADEDLRLKRLLDRREYEFVEAKNRIKAQMPQEEKMELVDHVLYNNTSLKNLEFQAELILKKVVKP